MDLQEKIEVYLNRPYPVWDDELCRSLALHKQAEVIKGGKINDEQGYHSAAILGYTMEKGIQTMLPGEHALPIELPQKTLLTNLYMENGLDVLVATEIDAIQASGKINAAMDVLSKVGTCAKSISILVQALQVLKEPEPEYDVSYSHPDIPFTIFVSVSAEASEISTLRLAESILHESMHLMLTLIESHIPLIEDHTQSFYSPWRETDRPIRGVLHGVFVFKSIMDFYQNLTSSFNSSQTPDFISFRIEQIAIELNSLKDLPNLQGFTQEGAILLRGLLPSN